MSLTSKNSRQGDTVAWKKGYGNFGKMEST